MAAVYSAFVDNKKKKDLQLMLHVFLTHIVSHIVLQALFYINYTLSAVSYIYMIGESK